MLSARTLVLALCTAALLPVGLSAWTMSVEFPYAGLPRPVWERELAHLKEMGVAHVSLPPAKDASQLDDVIRIVRRLGLEADLEGAIPDRLQPLAKAHGGPLTDALPAVRVAATMARAIDNERKLVMSGTQAILWTDVFETLSPAYAPGAITLAGTEGPAAAIIRREAQIARYWGSQLSALPESPGARLGIPVDNVTVHQYIADKPGVQGLSLTTVVNNSSDPWQGEVRVMYPAMQRPIALPTVSLQPYGVLWLPVNIPLTAGPLCTGCTGFGTSDHVAYATAELTDMEYENGVLAMEFYATSPGEVILQLSREPTGPLLAGGRPTTFDWEPKTQRVRLPIPAGNAKTGRVRVALAIDAPSATAFFLSPSVLLIGETNSLTAEFSPPAIVTRSRLRTTPEFTSTQEAKPDEDKEKPTLVTYKINVPSTAVGGDVAQLAIEADGTQLSHSQLRVSPSAELTFDDAIAIRVAADSFVPLSPAAVPVNQRSGREIVVSLRNNAPEIRTFNLELNVPGVEFSPRKMTVSVGALLARDLTFRIFSGATPGIHDGEVRLSGAARITEAVRFVVLPPTGSIAWSEEGFSILEDTKSRASFLGNQWLEMIDKESGRDTQPAGGTVLNAGSVETLKLEDLKKRGAGEPAPPVH